jgi:hypothetical protein
MKEIQLTCGKVAQVDDADFDALNAHKWYAFETRGKWYAARNAPRSKGPRKKLKMHAHILGVKDADHEDGNGLNNQRYNLRPANRRQQCWNAAKRSDNQQAYKGVKRDKRTGAVSARIKLDGKETHLGMFGTDQVAAAQAYDAAAVLHFGEFARLNFPVDKTPAVV